MQEENKKPEYMRKGEPARLIPATSAGNKEMKATSILLACLSVVRQFSKSFFQLIGAPAGTNTKIEVYTEVVFGNKNEEESLRPDGFIIIKSASKTWRAIVESKIGDSPLEEEQVKNYLALARKYGINALITFSNQYVATPQNHPLPISKNDRKKVDLYHFSWMAVITEAMLRLKEVDAAKNKDQKFILNEMVRYFNHDNSGICKFTKMNQEWKDVCQKIKTGASISKTSSEADNTVISWHQETKDISLMMSRKLNTNVTLHLSQKHKNDPTLRVRHDCEQMCSKFMLTCDLDVPNAASRITVKVNLSRCTIECAMLLDAPKDKKRASARLKWLTQQLKDKPNLEGVYIRALVQGMKGNLQVEFAGALDNPASLSNSGDRAIVPSSFQVVLIRDIASQFGRQRFITAVEDAVYDFYSNVGQYLKKWIEPAPKVIPSPENEQISEAGDAGSVPVPQAENNSESAPQPENTENRAGIVANVPDNFAQEKESDEPENPAETPPEYKPQN